MQQYILFSSDLEPNYWLSNFYPHNFKSQKKCQFLQIQYDGAEWPNAAVGCKRVGISDPWPTSEHLYQALKYECQTEAEKEWREHIRTANTPTIAKYLARLRTDTRYKWQNKYAQIVMKYKDVIRLAGDLEQGSFKSNIMYTACKAKFDTYPQLRQNLINTEKYVLGEDVGGTWGIRGENALGLILMRLREEYKSK